MIRTAFAAVAALGFANATFAGPPPMELKGVALGSSIAELQRIHTSAQCGAVQCSLRPAGAEGDMFFGPAWPDIYIYKYKDDKLGEALVYIKTRDVAPVIAALTAKYGHPSDVRNVPLQNGYGAVIANSVTEWKRPDGTIRAIEHLDMDNGGVVFTAKWYVSQVGVDKSKAAKDAASKL